MANAGTDFVGFVPRRTRVGLILTVPACLFALMFRSDVVSAVGDVARALEFVSVDTVSFAANALVVSSPALALLLALAIASRRSARAAITADHALIRPLRLPWPVLTVLLVDIVARRSTPFGVILVAPAAVPRPLSWLLAPLVPATTPEEQARAHAALDGPHVSGRASTAIGAGRVVGWQDLAVLLALATAWAIAAESHRRVLGDEVFGLTALGAPLLLVTALLARPARTRVALGADTLSVGGLCVGWDEVTAVTRAGPWFTLVAGRRTCVARPGHADAARLANAARGRLSQDRREMCVHEVASRWLGGRRRRALALAGLAVLAFAVAAGPVRMRLAEAYLLFVPDAGYHEDFAVLVFRKHDAAPLLAVLVEGAKCRAVRASGSWSARQPIATRERYSAYWNAPTDVVEVDARAGRVHAFGRDHDIPIDRDQRRPRVVERREVSRRHPVVPSCDSHEPPGPLLEHFAGETSAMLHEVPVAAHDGRRQPSSIHPRDEPVRPPAALKAADRRLPGEGGAQDGIGDAPEKSRHLVEATLGERAQFAVGGRAQYPVGPGLHPRTQLTVRRPERGRRRGHTVAAHVHDRRPNRDASVGSATATWPPASATETWPPLGDR